MKTHNEATAPDQTAKPSAHLNVADPPAGAALPIPQTPAPETKTRKARRNSDQVMVDSASKHKALIARLTAELEKAKTDFDAFKTRMKAELEL